MRLNGSIRPCHLQCGNTGAFLSGICHRDIKVENILLGGDQTVLVSDFGLSNTFTEGQLLTTFCGTYAYCAPEILVRRPYFGPEV